MSDANDRLTRLECELERERTARRLAESLLERKNRELFERTRLHESETAERIRAEKAAAQAEERARHQALLSQQASATQEAEEGLKDARDQLVQAEQLASLGELVAGITHEVNTPIGIAVTAASTLRDDAQRLQQAVRDGTLKRSMLEELADSSRDSAQMILSNLARASQLMSSFKQVAVDRTSHQPREVLLREFIEELLLSLRPKLKKSAVELSIDCDPGLRLYTVPGALSQVLTNLIMNSLLHGFGDGDEQARRVRIAATAVGTDVAIQYADNGRGIDPEILPRIFDPFFTTRRGSGGSGLGMHIVRKLVHDTLGGTIAARSTPGDGAHFDLRLRDLATARPNETGEQAIGNG